MLPALLFRENNECVLNNLAVLKDYRYHGIEKSFLIMPEKMPKNNYTAFTYA